MKNTLGLLMLLVAFSVTGQAQMGWRAGLKAGVSIPKLRAPNDGSSSYSNGFQTVVGPQAGIVLEYKFCPHFSLQTEVNYSTQGGEKNGEQRINTNDFKAYIPANVSLPDYIYANFNNRITLVYIELPVMPKYSIQLSQKYRLGLYGGPYIGYLVSAQGEASGKSKIYTDPQHTKELTYNGFAIGEVDFGRKEDILEQLSRTNYGIQGGTAIEYNKNQLNYFLAIAGTYGFRRLQKDPNFGNNKTGGLSLSFGITHKL